MYRALHDSRGIAGVLYLLGWIASLRGDAALATSRFEESLALNRDLGNKVSLGSSLSALALASLRFSDQSASPRVGARLQESLALFRQEGYQEGIAESLYFLGLWHFQQGEVATARALFEESFALFTAMGRQLYSAVLLCYLAKA